MHILKDTGAFILWLFTFYSYHTTIPFNTNTTPWDIKICLSPQFWTGQEHYLVRIKSHQTLKGQDIGIKYYDYHLLNQHRIVPSSFSESIKIMSLKYRTDLLLKGMWVSFHCFDKRHSVMSPRCLAWPGLISMNYSAQANEPSTLIGGQKTAQSERDQTE